MWRFDVPATTGEWKERKLGTQTLGTTTEDGASIDMADAGRTAADVWETFQVKASADPSEIKEAHKQAHTHTH